MDPKNGCFFAAAAASILLLMCSAACASGFSVSPITFASKGGIETITVSNVSDDRIYIEAGIFDWSKDQAGKDILTESDAAIVSPPAMWIPAHSSYLVRVRLPRPDGPRELPFRITLEQVVDRAALRPGKISMMIKYNLAAFSEPDQPAAPQLRALLEDGKLVIENHGGLHAKIDGIAQDGKDLAKGLLGYALPDSRVTLKVQVHPGQIDLTTNVGHIPLNVQ